MKALFITSPNEEYITTGSSAQHPLLKSRHEKACKGRSHPGSHASLKDLSIMIIHESEVALSKSYIKAFRSPMTGQQVWPLSVNT